MLRTADPSGLSVLKVVVPQVVPLFAIPTDFQKITGRASVTQSHSVEMKRIASHIELHGRSLDLFAMEKRDTLWSVLNRSGVSVAARNSGKSSIQPRRENAMRSMQRNALELQSRSEFGVPR